MNKRIKNVKPLFLTAKKIKKIKKDDELFYHSLSFGSVVLYGENDLKNPIFQSVGFWDKPIALENNANDFTPLARLLDLVNRADDKEFKEWFIKQTKDLLKNNIIGHVHIADNFGYYDEHLTPGEGNVPIEEFIKEVTKAGLKDKMIIEPGAQGEGESIYGSMFGAWAKIASSPIYRVGNVSRSWTDVSGSYFGATHTPRYMTGGYLVDPKSEENWWSGVPIE